MLKLTHQPKSMLITGGAGFIGANFVRFMLAQYPQIRIINLDKLTYAGSLKNLDNLPNANQHHFVQGDISDATLVNDIMNKYEIDTIVHFAAESHVDRSIHSPSAFIETNVMGTFVLLEAAKKYWLQDMKIENACRFHHISTDEVFGSLGRTDPAFTETTAYQPRSPYSASKASSDHLVQAYHHTYGLPVTISNCSNNYGPYQHNEKFIPTVIRACLNKQPIPIYGNGKNIRDWLFVDDHCRAIATILLHGENGESYNVGANNEWDNLSLANYICVLMNEMIPWDKPYESLLQFVTDRAGHDFRYAINSQKLLDALAWQSTENMKSGLKKTIQFFLVSGGVGSIDSDLAVESESKSLNPVLA